MAPKADLLQGSLDLLILKTLALGLVLAEEHLQSTREPPPSSRHDLPPPPCSSSSQLVARIASTASAKSRQPSISVSSAARPFLVSS